MSIMWPTGRAFVILLAYLAPIAIAADVVYVTDLEVFTYLAPCAADALRYDIATQTMRSVCGEKEDELQSCICTPQFSQVSSAIATDVESSCGPSATDDVSSASRALYQYCNQGEKVTFSTPTTNIVHAFITDIPEMGYLPRCAKSALADAVMGNGYSRCPTAAELMAPCICSKSAVVSRIQESIRQSVKISCSNNEDVTLAYNSYSAFCRMNEGTSSFAAPARPPGDITYHITALPQFKSLNECAQSGLSGAVKAQDNWRCGSGPQELASCVCIKSGMSRYVSSYVTSEVKYYCNNTAIADVSSALDAFGYYCSAAEGKVVATVAESIVQTYGTVKPGPGTNIVTPTQTAQSEDTGKQSDTEKTEAGSSSDNNKVASIAGGVAGSVAALGLIGVVLLFMRRRRQRQQSENEELSSHPDDDPNGKPELMGSGVAPGGSGVPINYRPKEELDSVGTNITELPQNEMPHELDSSITDYEAPPNLQGQPVPEAVTPSDRSQTQGGMGWQSGPVDEYGINPNTRH